MCLCAVYCDCGVSDFCELVPLAGVCVCAFVCVAVSYVCGAFDF